MPKVRTSLASPDLQFKDPQLTRLMDFVRALAVEVQKVQQMTAGGTTDQVLVKTGGADYAAAWGEGGGGGTVTDGQNLGAGTGLFKDLEGSLLSFKSLVEGANVTISNDGESVTIASVGTVGPEGPAGPTGPKGDKGDTGNTGATGAPGSVWRNGTGAPSNSLGVDGDFYLDDATGNVYQKLSGTYSIVANIEGPTGPVGPAANITPDTHPGTSTAWDDEFEFGTTIDTVGSRFAGANPWVIMGPTGGAYLVADGSLLMSVASAVGQLLVVQSVPSGTWTFEARMAGSDNQAQGLVAYNSSNNDQLVLVAIGGVSGSNTIIQENVFVNGAAPTFNSNPYVNDDYAIFGPQGAYRYYQLKYDGTNFTMSLSASGAPGSFLPIFTSTYTATWGYPFSHIGFCSWGGAPTSVLAVDWFRRTA